LAKRNVDEYQDYQQVPEFYEKWPEGIQGNSVNGLGELDNRPPNPILWHFDTSKTPFGDLQTWYFFEGGLSDGATNHHKANIEYMSQPPSPIAEERPVWTPKEWTEKIKKMALECEADIVGITRMDPSWIFETYEHLYEWSIVMGYRQDPDCRSIAAEGDAQTEYQNQYRRGNRSAKKLSNWIREHGYDAIPHGGPEAGSSLLIPAAIKAGLGELGKHGSMINREYGSWFRLAAVETNIELIEDVPDNIGGDDFCINCQICPNICPVAAISDSKQLVRGQDKWYVDFDKCIPFFMGHYGCGLCIAECPWSLPGVGPNLAAKLAKRRAS